MADRQLLDENIQERSTSEQVQQYSQLSTNMLEFLPFDPFSSYITTSYDYSISESDNLQKKSETNTQDIGESDSIENEDNKKKRVNANASEEHNMVKHLINTIKQMVGKHIDEIGNNSNTKQIISQTWNVLSQCKNPTRKLLRAIFDKKTDKRQIDSQGLGQILKEHGLYYFKQAMDELRYEIIFRLRNQNLKSHVLNRNLQKKQRLVAYTQYFIQEELKKGEILCRTTESARKKIEQIIVNNKKQNQFLDYCLVSNTQVSFGFFTQQSNL